MFFAKGKFDVISIRETYNVEGCGRVEWGEMYQIECE